MDERQLQRNYVMEFFCRKEKEIYTRCMEHSSKIFDGDKEENEKWKDLLFRITTERKDCMPYIHRADHLLYPYVQILHM